MDAEDFDDEAGIFTWYLDTQKFYGDSTVAAIFCLNPHETLTGLPLSVYTDRIHPDDRASAIKLVSKAVRDGKPYRAEYRVIAPEGAPRWVVAFGRCFRDHTGNPRCLSGIVHCPEGSLEYEAEISGNRMD